MRRAQEEAGTIGPASGVERVGTVFTDHLNVAGADESVAQYGSVPQT